MSTKDQGKIAIPDVVITEDGSPTCFDAQMGELYHNRAGAYTEALKNYVEPSGLDTLLERNERVVLLDVCFGLGYNTFVFIDRLLHEIDRNVANDRSMNLNVIALDKEAAILKVLPIVLNDHRLNSLKKRLEAGATHRSPEPLFPDFGKHEFLLDAKRKLSLTIDLRCVDLREALPELADRYAKSLDLIFHDGFSLNKIPELWTIEIFELYTKMLNPTGKILTYSSAAAVRGALRACGLDVRRTTACGGKSGGTIAFRPGQLFSGKYVFELSEAEQDRLSTNSAIPYRDPGMSNSREEIVRKRNEELRATKG